MIHTIDEDCFSAEAGGQIIPLLQVGEQGGVMFIKQDEDCVGVSKTQARELMSLLAHFVEH